MRDLEVEIVGFRGRPVAFEVTAARDDGTAVPADPSGLATSIILGTVRPALILLALFIGIWLARRNLRAGRGDTKRAARLAGVMLGIRVLAWVLGAHHTPGSVTTQLMTTLAWGLYDAAYAWVFYVAIEPYVRRLWPRLLTSWVRLFDGRVGDAQVGRDLLVGSLIGAGVALAVAAHQALPVVFGQPPGRPDNVGYVEQQLAALLGLRHQLGEIFALLRSSMILLMGFLLILVMARLTLRHAATSVLVAGLIFVPLALPKGDLMALNVGFAVVIAALLLAVMFRFGLLAAGVALVTHALLESAPLGMGLGAWPTSRTTTVLAITLGIGLYGFARSLGGRAAIRDVLAEEG
jgi:hypothetical protein